MGSRTFDGGFLLQFHHPAISLAEPLCQRGPAFANFLHGTLLIAFWSRAPGSGSPWVPLPSLRVFITAKQRTHSMASSSMVPAWAVGLKSRVTGVVEERIELKFVRRCAIVADILLEDSQTLPLNSFPGESSLWIFILS